MSSKNLYNINVSMCQPRKYLRSLTLRELLFSSILEVIPKEVVHGLCRRKYSHKEFRFPQTFCSGLEKFGQNLSHT